MPEDIDEVRRTCGLQRDVSRQSCALKRRKLTRGREKGADWLCAWKFPGSCRQKKKLPYEVSGIFYMSNLRGKIRSRFVSILC